MPTKKFVRIYCTTALVATTVALWGLNACNSVAPNDKFTVCPPDMMQAMHHRICIEQKISAALPYLSGSAAAISSVTAMAASLVPAVFAPNHSPRAPILTMAPAPAPALPDPSQADSTTRDTNVTPAWLAAALEQARSAAKEAETRLKSEKRKRRRLKKIQAQLAEELQRTLQTVAQLEQVNAELHQYVAAECQQIKSNGRSTGLE